MGPLGLQEEVPIDISSVHDIFFFTEEKTADYRLADIVGEEYGDIDTTQCKFIPMMLGQNYHF